MDPSTRVLIRSLLGLIVVMDDIIPLKVSIIISFPFVESLGKVFMHIFMTSYSYMILFSKNSFHQIQYAS